jgi:uncharacterized protein YutE (UPF0331/DUF86 family)
VNVSAGWPKGNTLFAEVLARKLERLRSYLSDLAPHRGKTAAEVRDDPYEIERLLELLVQVAVDILAHELAERGETVSSYRESFERAGQVGLVPEELAARLMDAAGLRYVLVHLYEEIDYEIVAASIGQALDDFEELFREFERRLRGADR